MPRRFSYLVCILRGDMPTTVPHHEQKSNPSGFVLAGGLVAGTLDIIFACGFWAWKLDVPPERILQSVAAGLLGDVSFDGGWGTAALGLLLHYFIALSMCVVYYQVARRWPLLWRRPFLCGALYGLLLYVAMNYVVVPLSAAGPGSKDRLWIALSIAAHVFLIGMPCAIFARLAVQAHAVFER